MKASSLFTVLLASALMLSCKNQTKEMLTVIHPDGSCYREFKTTTDSATVVGDSVQAFKLFPVKKDSSWHASWQYNTQPRCDQFPADSAVMDSVIKSAPSSNSREPGTFTLFLRRDFRSVEEMAAQFRLLPENSLSKVKVKYDFEKRFRWFYTYYRYRETYPKLNLKFTIPTGEYMTADEASFWFTGQPNITQGLNGMEIKELMSSIETKYNKWLTHNIWELEFPYLVKYYDLLPKPPVSKTQFIALKDSIYQTCVSKSTENFDLDASLNSFFKTKQFSLLWKQPQAPMKKMEEIILGERAFLFFNSDFLYKLEMPGTVISSNSSLSDGNTLVWHLTSVRFVLNDYSLEAESRKANIWAFVATALLVVVAIASFLFKIKR